MQFSVIGLRFDHLRPEDQVQFSYSQHQLQMACAKIKRQTQSISVMVLSTCDRVEVWCEEPKRQIMEPFLRSLSLPVLVWSKQLYSIDEEKVIEHLFRLACGLESPLFGEDQIISQLNFSLSLSRLAGCASPLLEYLVREAVTLAKAVQSSVDLQVADETVAHAVSALLKQKSFRTVLVIGSSNIARLVSEHLVQEGCLVWMTFRDLDKADLLLPPQVQAVAYENRFNYFEQVDVAISATKGMTYTITKDKAIGVKLLIDLAPVKDIDPEVSLPLVRIEDLHVALPKRQEAQQQALILIEAHLKKTKTYLSYRPKVQDIQNIGIQAANDLLYRLNSVLDEHHVDDDMRKTLYESARKAFTHQLYEQEKNKSGQVRYDLTQCLVSGKPEYAGDPQTLLEKVHTLDTHNWRLTYLHFGSHTATHIDSPSHLIKEGKSLDQYPPSRFFANAFVLDCSNLSQIDIEDLPSHEYCFDAILFYTGNEQHRPMLSLESAKNLLGRGVRLFGFDGPSCDAEGDEELPIHHLLLDSDALIIENLVNLQPILNKVVCLTCLPLLYEDADGAPARVIASLMS
jgi:glutamyl-tRNA reductase